MQEVEGDILKRVLRQVDLGSTDPPDIQDVPTRYFER
jgi:hypothetical protein